MVIADAPTLYDPKEAEEEYGIEIESDLLAPFRPHLGPETDTASETSQSTAPAADPEGKQGDPGTTVLIENLGPNNTELHFAHRIVSSSRQSVSESSDTAMTDPPEAAEATEGPDISSGAESSVHPNGASSKAELEQQSASTDGVFDAHALKEAATASLLEHEAVSQQQQKGALEKRHDSAQGQVPQLRREKRQPRSGRNSPSLRLQTNRVVPQPEDTIATSPNLSKHVIERGAETLPALHKSPIKEGSTVSPQAEKLPPIRQLVTTTQLEPLEELAQVATQHDPRYAHNHSQSYGSATSQSPVMAYHHYPSTAQTSPSSQHAYSTRSPNSAFSETYGSPTQYSHATAYFADRRSSAPTENHPPPPPSLPSASSSGESHGPASSSADGYSTQHTTPVDLPDGTPRPILPPPAGMPQGAVVITTGYKCDYPGCFAAPFQTQYLLRFALSNSKVCLHL